MKSDDAISQPPRGKEFELSLFGPGFGECLLIHLGINEWVIVDSCMTDSTKPRPVALVYLENMGLDPSKVVKTIICTHWHKDHTEGLYQIVQSCPNAEVYISSVLQGDHFLQYSAIMSGRPREAASITEFVKVITLLAEEKSKGKAARGPKRASADKTIWQRESAPLAGSIRALSPSDGDEDVMINEVGKMLASGEMSERPHRSLPNHAAVALRVEVGDVRVVLGSDLECHPSLDRGWGAVLSSRRMPAKQAGVYKVAHHGSVTGDHAEIWVKMLSPRPICLLTPYSLAGNWLPTKEDCVRVLSKSGPAYITQSTPFKEYTFRSGNEGFVMKCKERDVVQIRSAHGHIRLRVGMENAQAWNIDCFGAAVRLSRAARKPRKLRA